MILFPVTDERKMHVARIFGTNRDGDRLDSLWLDLLRIDEIVIKSQDTVHQFQFTNQYQKTTIRLKWGDNFGVDGDDQATSRLTEIIKVCGSDQDDPADPDEWVPVRDIKHVRLDQTQTISTRRFISTLTDLKNRKEFEVRRFLHSETTIDEDAQSAFDAGQNIFVTTTDNYTMTGEPDKGDYVEHEVAKRYGSQATHHWLETSGDDLTTTFLMKNNFLIDASDSAMFDKVGPDGRNPPWRLSPFQNIINCQLGGLAVEFLTGAA